MPSSNKHDRKRPYTISVLLRFSLYAGTEIYDHNTVTCNKAKYGRKRPYFSRMRSYTTVYGVRNVRSGVTCKISFNLFLNIFQVFRIISFLSILFFIFNRILNFFNYWVECKRIPRSTVADSVYGRKRPYLVVSLKVINTVVVFISVFIIIAICIY